MNRPTHGLRRRCPRIKRGFGPRRLLSLPFFGATNNEEGSSSGSATETLAGLQRAIWRVGELVRIISPEMAIEREDIAQGWVCLRCIGRGGNARVYEACRPGQSDLVALKVLKATNSGTESYLRFRNEIDFLTTLGERPGILPVLDHHLPEAPAQSDKHG